MSTRKEYAVLLEGVDALDLPLSVLRDLCDVLVEGAQRSARLVGEGRSVARGAVPAWATNAADLRVSKFAPGSLDLAIRAPQLVEVAPEIFAQQELFPSGLAADSSAFDLFLDAAEDAASGKRDSDRLDAGVLEVLSRAGTLLARGPTRLTVANAGRRRLVLDIDGVKTIRELADSTPAPRVTRVRGVLDALTVSTRTTILRLADGSVLRGVASGVPFDVLKQLLGSDVVVEGTVSYRPSGQALRIEIESATPAMPGDVIWAQLPRVEASATRPRGGTSSVGLDAFFGTWPGDETDAELAAALRDAS